MATAVLPHSLAERPSPSLSRARLGLYSTKTFWQSLLAVAVLPLHIFSPNIGLLARALVQTPITWSARFDSLMPLLLTSLSWQSFERTTSGGLYADAATGLEGYAYIFGVSLMIFRYLSFRASYPQLAGKALFDRRFLVLCLLLALTLVAAYRGVIAGERGWSSPFRSALTAGGFFYGIILAQTYGPRVKMMAGFYLPAGLIFYGLSSLDTLDHRLIWTLAPFVSAASAYILVTQPLSWSGLLAAATLAVSGWRCVLGPLSTGTLLLLWSCGLVAALFATRQTLGLGRFVRRPVVLIFAAGMIVATVYVTLNKQDMAAEAVRRDESISRYLWWKLVEDRGLIWSQAMDAFVSRPLSDILFVPGGASIDLRYGGKFYNMKIGLHNAYLDLIYYQGLVPGGLFCCYILLLCWDCLKALGKKLPADIEIMAFGVLITAIVGGFSGQYFIHQEGGTWFYLPAGIVSGYYFRHRLLESASRPVLSPGLR